MTDSFDFLERQWKDPPVGKIFVPINRQYLEREVDIHSSQRGNHSMNLSITKPKKDHKSIDSEDMNWVAHANLQARDHPREYGLWNGGAKVFLFGRDHSVSKSYSGSLHRGSFDGAFHISIVEIIQ